MLSCTDYSVTAIPYTPLFQLGINVPLGDEQVGALLSVEATKRLDVLGLAQCCLSESFAGEVGLEKNVFL